VKRIYTQREEMMNIRKETKVKLVMKRIKSIRMRRETKTG
jgi:hypothetical protein